MDIDKARAETILREEAGRADVGPVDADWVAKIEKVSKFCEEGAPVTHIAFLATSILARATDPKVDLFHIKPKLSKTNPNAYSARTLSEQVLVPLSAELGFSIGANGRQPLNNQPYFRMSYLGDDTPIHSNGRSVFDYMVRLVRELSKMTPAAARQALRAFIAVRRKYQRRYTVAGEVARISPETLIDACRCLVADNSEGGRRAQAIVAGLLDVVAGEDRVESGLINDPSRHYPGDVALKAPGAASGWEKSFEVRDKPVSLGDVAIFARTCVNRDVREAAIVMAVPTQQQIDVAYIRGIVSEYGVSITLFRGLDDFVAQCLFWAPPPQPEAASAAVQTIRERLIGVEASPSAVAMWDRLTQT